MNYGYARVSSKEQNEQRQMIALTEFGIAKKNIYMDKQSGKDFDRPRYKRQDGYTDNAQGDEIF